MEYHPINPKRWYILDLRDPKNPIVPITAFMFKELAVEAIARYFPNTSMVTPVLGQELIEYSIMPKYSAYKRFRFHVNVWAFGAELTRRQKHTLAKAARRRRRIDKFKAMTGHDYKNPLHWGDILPKNIPMRAGKKKTNRERYNLRAKILNRLYSQYDHL